MIKLPEQEIDGHEVEWFTINICYRIEHHRAKFHVNTSWEDGIKGTNYERLPMTSHHRTGGVAFVNHWQVFRDGDFCGRSSDGWDALRFGGEFNPAYATREEAETAQRAQVKRRIKRLREDIEEMEELL